MSVARPARCLFCRFRPASFVPRVSRRQFHLSPIYRSDDQSPKESDEPKGDVDVPQKKTLAEIERTMKPENFKPFTAEEKERLSKVYSPKQMEAIEAGEAAIDPKDLAEQFALERGPFKHNYVDDFSTIEPGVDKHVRAPISNTDHNAELKTDDDFDEDFANFFGQMPEDAGTIDWLRFVEGLRVTRGKPENELNPHTSLVPDAFQPGETVDEDPKEPKPQIEETEDAKGGEGMLADMKQLLITTGYTEYMVRSLRAKKIVFHNVTNQTRLGKIHKKYALSVAGNGNGLLGIGEAKAFEPIEAINQSKYRAIRNMQPIPRYEERTIFGDVRGKVGATELVLMNRPPGLFTAVYHP